MTNGWTITLEAAGPPAGDLDAFELQVEELLDALEFLSASVAHAPTGDRLAVTIAVESATPDAHESTAHAAPMWAENAAATLEAMLLVEKAFDRVGLPDWPIVNVHTRTWAEHDAELAVPAYPELVGVAEIAELIGVTRQRVSELRGRTGFPEPIADLRSGPVWTRASVDRFVSEWPRKPGRPRALVDLIGESESLAVEMESASFVLPHNASRMPGHVVFGTSDLREDVLPVVTPGFARLVADVATASTSMPAFGGLDYLVIAPLIVKAVKNVIKAQARAKAQADSTT